MAKQKAAAAAKSSQLLQFRATLDLEQLVRPFAERQGLTMSTAFKDLAGLAIIGLDHRHYPLVNQLATTMGGECAFAKACVYLHAALAGASLARGGTVLYEEPARTQLVFDVVRDYLSTRGVGVKADGLWFTPTADGLAGSVGQTAPELVPDDTGSVAHARPTPDLPQVVRHRQSLSSSGKSTGHEPISPVHNASSPQDAARRWSGSFPN
ncbi:MAG: hypothetical protein U0792_11755 [Gemmataceae bacterium]